MCLVCRNSISIQTVLQISSQVDWPILWNCWVSQWQAIFVLRGLHSLGSRLSLIMLLLDYVVYLARKMVKQSVALLLPSCNSWLISNAQKWQQRFNNWYINTQKGNLLPVVLQLTLGWVKNYIDEISMFMTTCCYCITSFPFWLHLQFIYVALKKFFHNLLLTEGGK